MNNLDIYTNPRLLEKMTQQANEVLSYEEQIERFKALQLPKKPRKHFKLKDIPF